MTGRMSYWRARCETGRGTRRRRRRGRRGLAGVTSDRDRGRQEKKGTGPWHTPGGSRWHLFVVIRHNGPIRRFAWSFGRGLGVEGVAFWGQLITVEDIKCREHLSEGSRLRICSVSLV